MTSTLQLSSAERIDSGASLPGRSSPTAAQGGPSFADLLQRGQASSGAAAAAADPPTAQSDAPPGQDVASERSDAVVDAPATELPGNAASEPAKPAPRARGRTPALASAMRASSAREPGVAPNSNAIMDRPATDGGNGEWPPGTMPIADLQAWMAALTPPEALPAPCGPAAAPVLTIAAAVAGPARAAGEADPPGLAADANAPVAAYGAAALLAADSDAPRRPAGSTAEPRLADGVAVLATTGPAALMTTAPAARLTPADRSALPRRTDRPAAPLDRNTLPLTPDNASAPRPAPGAAALIRTESTTVPDPADGAALLAPSVRDAALVPPDGTAAPRPAPGSMNALLAQRNAAERIDARRSDSVASVQAALPSPQGLDPAALGFAGRRPTAPALPAARDFVQGLVSGATGTVPRGLEAGAPAPITLATPLHAPDFAQLLGAQVSVLARDGVQQAELHLNPAEMGPISVHIRIDDGNARVDFHAGAAATREVIERGLPELASALREQGLTLAGGGVFQQPPDTRGQAQREPGGAASHSPRFTSMQGEGPVRTITIPLPQGTLDVYA